MAMSNLSIMGLYNYDSSIFDDFNVPSGLTKQLAVDTILMDCAELELLYSDLDILKYAITQWSAKQQANWQKLYNTTVLTYNPIYNKDGTIIEIEKITNDDTITVDGEIVVDRDTSDTNGTTLTSTEQVSAFNSTAFENRNKTTNVPSGSNSGTDDSTTSEDTTTEFDKEENRTFTRTEKGNIGITTTQQMIKEEREVDLFNMYDVISKSFKNRFCLMIY